MNIQNSRDLRAAYESLNIWRELMQDARHEYDEKISRAEQRIRELKRDIRAYYKRQAAEQERGVYTIRNDWDGFIKVIPLPQDWTRDDAEEFYETEEFLPRPNSIYDCTGQLFTAWHSIVRRAGRWYLYHCISMDV